MRKINLILIPFITVLSLSIISCKKDTSYINTPSGNLLVGNMVVGGAALTMNGLGSTVSNNNSASYPLYAGTDSVRLYNAAVKPVVNYYSNQNLVVANVDNYSLFLAGASPTAVDPILIKETYNNYSDSTCGVRFMNLSPGSPTISVNITGQPNGSEVTNLAYLAYTDFIKYPATVAHKTYSFQIKNVGTGTTIANYTLTTPFFHNVTIVLRGLVGGSPAAGVTLVAHP